MTSLSDASAPGTDPAPVAGLANAEGLAPATARAAVPDGIADAIGRHPTSIGQHVDTYLAAVERELGARGVVTGSPQRTSTTRRLVGSIVVDCTALGVAVQAAERRPLPVIVTWDEVTGWCAGLHLDPVRSSRRYLHPDLLPPAAAVADFVVRLAWGEPVGATEPIGVVPPPSRPHLRLVL